MRALYRAPNGYSTITANFPPLRFNGDQLVSPAYVTVLHNGIVVHNHTTLLGPTQHRRVTAYRPHPPTGPLQLQDHGARVRYRNIWYRSMKGYDEP